MRDRDRDSLIDILESAKLALSFVDNISRGEFENDIMRQAAVIRQFEIIGEATKRISEEYRQSYPDIQWKQMAGMRDILIHAYQDVDLDEIWNALKNALPKLVEKLQDMI